MCLCVGNESISFTLVSTPDGGSGGLHMRLLPFCFLPLSVFSHMFIESCHYISPSHLSHTLPIPSSASHLCTVTLYLSLSIFGCPPIHSQFGCFLSFCLFLFHNHSLRIHFNLSFTHSFSILRLHLHPFLSLSLSIRMGSFKIRLAKTAGCGRQMILFKTLCIRVTVAY